MWEDDWGFKKTFEERNELTKIISGTKKAVPFWERLLKKMRNYSATTSKSISVDCPFPNSIVAW